MMHVRVNVPPVPAALEAMAEGLVRLNEFFIRHALEKGVELPSLYTSGIVYRREPPGQEWWESAADVYTMTQTTRSGDCEDLAAFRAAELRVFDNDDAVVAVVPTRRGSFHAIVEHEDGTMEDPSRILVNLERARLDRAKQRARRARKAA